MNFLLGMLFIVVWSGIVYYSKQFERWFGRWIFAEQYFWGTAQWYVLLGFVLLVIWLLTLFGVVDLSV